MARQFSEHSYQYIQGWLKKQLKVNPEFKQKKDAVNTFNNMKYKAQRIVRLIQLKQLEEFASTLLF